MPSTRSVEMLRTRAIGARRALDRAALAELLADAFRASPTGHDLGAALADLGDEQLPADALAVDLRQHAHDGLRRGGVAEAGGDEQPPVPLARPVVHLRVDLAEEDGAVDVAALVVDPQVDLEVGPVRRERVEDALEVFGEGHRGKG